MFRTAGDHGADNAEDPSPHVPRPPPKKKNRLIQLTHIILLFPTKLPVVVAFPEKDTQY